MKSVITKQWTTISLAEMGDGPEPLVYVHGTAADHAEANGLARALGATFHVLAPDRRGRGKSEDEPHFSLAREAESDVLAVVNGCSAPVVVVGHGYGAALCVRMAPLAQSPIRALVLVEGGVVDAPAEGDPGLLTVSRELEDLLGADDHDGVVARFLAEVSGLGKEQIDVLRAAPSWAGRVGASRTTPREVRALATATLSADQARGIRVPTLLLQTAAAADWVRAGVDRARAVLANARSEVVRGHAATLLEHDAGELAAAITAFVQGVGTD